MGTPSLWHFESVIYDFYLLIQRLVLAAHLAPLRKIRVTITELVVMHPSVLKCVHPDSQYITSKGTAITQSIALLEDCTQSDLRTEHCSCIVAHTTDHCKVVRWFAIKIFEETKISLIREASDTNTTAT